MTIDEKLAKLEQLTLQVEAFARAHQMGGQLTALEAVAVACLEITTEHVRSVVILARRFQYNTAFALMRIENESLIRAFWWTHCGCQADLEKLQSDQFNIDYKKMKTDLDRSGKARIYQTVETLRRNVHMQHSFTHTGRDQIFRRLASSSRASVGGVFDDQDSEQLYKYNEGLLLRVCLAYSELFSDPVFNMSIEIVMQQFDCMKDAGSKPPL